MQDDSTDEPASHGGGQFYEVMDSTGLQAADPAGLRDERQAAADQARRAVAVAGGDPGRVQDGQVDQPDRVHRRLPRNRLGGMGGWREDNVYYAKDVEI